MIRSRVGDDTCSDPGLIHSDRYTGSPPDKISGDEWREFLVSSHGLVCVDDFCLCDPGIKRGCHSSETLCVRVGGVTLI